MKIRINDTVYIPSQDATGKVVAMTQQTCVICDNHGQEWAESWNEVRIPCEGPDMTPAGQPRKRDNRER